MAFRFLDLAAELRNRIYDLAATTDEPIRITRENIQNSGRCYAALTHVCRQVRQEYLKIQRRGARLEVDWDELPHYIATFHADEYSYELAPKELRLRLTRLFDDHENPKPPVDILPLIRLKTRNAAMEVCATADPCTGDFADYVNEIFDDACLDLGQLLNNVNGNWAQWVRSHRLVSIIVQHGISGLNHAAINITFAPGDAEIDSLSDLPSFSKSSFSKSVLESIGFGRTRYLDRGHFVVTAGLIGDTFPRVRLGEDDDAD